MYRIFNSVLFSVFVFTATISNAATKAQKIEACLNNQLSPEAAKDLATEIEVWLNVFSTYVQQNAGECYTKITGKPSAFISGEGLVFEAAQIEAAKSKLKQRAIAEDANKAIIEQLNQELEQLKLALPALAKESPIVRRRQRCELLEARSKLKSSIEDLKAAYNENTAKLNTLKREATNEALKECDQWYSENKRASLTNTVCKDLFSEFGIPSDKSDRAETLRLAFAKRELVDSEELVSLIDLSLQTIAVEDRLVSSIGEMARIKQTKEREIRQKYFALKVPTLDVCDEEWKIFKLEVGPN